MEDATIKIPTMKFAIIGSRTFNGAIKIDGLEADAEDSLFSLLDSLKSECGMVVSGGAKGADSLGEKWAKQNNIATKIFKPDWDKHGKRAGFLRNEDIIKNADYVIAFWDGESKGTRHSIDLALKHKKQLMVVVFNKEIV